MNRRVEYVRQFASPEESHDAARRDAIDALAAIAKLASGKDIARVLQSVRVTTAMSDAHTAELGPVLLELVTLALTATDGPPGPASTADDSPGWFPPDVVEAAVRAWEAGTTLMMFGLDSNDTFTRIEFASRMREITLRSPVYPHMLLDTYRHLFSDAPVDADIRTALGFGGVEAVDVLAAARLASVGNLQQRFDRFSKLGEEVGRHAARRRRNAGARASGIDLDLTEESTASFKAIIDALQELTTNVGDSALLDVDEIARSAGVTPEVTTQVLDAFEYREQLTFGEAVDRFFAGDNPLRTAPVIRNRDGRYIIVHDGLVLPAIREKVETGLEQAGLRIRYQEHRSRWVEANAVDLLLQHFPAADVHRGFKSS